MSELCDYPKCGRSMHARGLCNGHDQQRRRGVPLSELQPFRNTRTPSERFWDRVDRSGDCWEWNGSINNKGYGNFRVSNKTLLSHRFAYEDSLGPIPEGMVIDHICHVTSCCNPDHLRLATQKQNMENQLGARRDSRSGLRGVERDSKTGRYAARVQHNKIRYHGGMFDAPEEAAEAARQLRLSLFTHNDADRKAS